MTLNASRPLPQSLYAETARPAIQRPPIDGDWSVSVAVVGGGYTGLSTALHLAERGIDATVLERHEPGWGASGRNGGQVNSGLYPNPATVVAGFGEELGRRMLRHAAGAPNPVFELIARHDLDCEAANSGTLRVAINGRGLARAAETYRQWLSFVGDAAWLNRDAVAQASGTGRYAGGIFSPRAARSIRSAMPADWPKQRCAPGRASTAPHRRCRWKRRAGTG